MADKLRELTERWKTRYTAFDVPMDVDRHNVSRRCADELLSILDAEGDGGTVACGYLITWNDPTYRGKQTLSFDRCNEDDGHYAPVFTRHYEYPHSENMVQKTIDALQRDIDDRGFAEIRSSELSLLAEHTHPARSGVVSDEDAHAALMVFRKSGWEGGRSQPEVAMRAALEHFAKSQGESNV